MKPTLIAILFFLATYSFAQSVTETINEVGFAVETTVNSTIIIRKIDMGSPAFKAGLKKNDMIISVKKDLTSESVQLAQLPIDEVEKLLKGSKGSMITLEFIRYPGKDVKKVTFARTGDFRKQ